MQHKYVFRQCYSWQQAAKLAYLVQVQEKAAAELLRIVLQLLSGLEDVLSMHLAVQSMDTAGEE